MYSRRRLVVLSCWQPNASAGLALAVDRLLPDGLSWKDEAVRIGST